MQAILGSNGAIGLGVARYAKEKGIKTRLFSRNPKELAGGEELMQGNILSLEAVRNAVKVCDVAYLTVGLRYSAKVWAEEWPIVMTNTIEACKAENVKLVFFDNVYSYGKVTGWMTEETPFNPCSKKGEVRAKVVTNLLEEMKSGNIKGLIARAPDFYGPDTNNSAFNLLVVNNLIKGKTPMWVGKLDAKHTYIYTHDAGKATAMLGNEEMAYGKTWHLPTDRNALTGKDFIKLFADEVGADSKVNMLSNWMLKAIGLFNEPVKESVEMNYQFESDYLFDSSKFEKTFNYQPTPYQDGVIKLIESSRNSLK